MPRKLVFEVTIIDNTSDDEPNRTGNSDTEEAENIRNCIYDALGYPDENAINISVKLLNRETLDE